MPKLSDHYASRKPSAIRQAQILFAQRPDRDAIECINIAVGNVSLPMHPAMQRRLRECGEKGFADGVVKYTATVGTDEARRTFLHIIASSGFSTEGVDVVVTDGGSMAMELMLLGVAGPGAKRPVLLLDPAYTNYVDIAARACIPTVSSARQLESTSKFSTPHFDALTNIVKDQKPTALVAIPADNPTGQFLQQESLVKLARFCVEHDLWLVSDEAYRELQYDTNKASSVWGISESDAPGIAGRRISIETASKVWNACGLRIGALVTDNAQLHAKSVAEYTANLSSNAIGQHVFAGLLGESHEALRKWYTQQRAYYADMMTSVTGSLRKSLPGVVVSDPEASLYSVVDVRDIAPAGFDAAEFVAYCANVGAVEIGGRKHTLLAAPMKGFYAAHSDASRTQMRLAYVASAEQMAKVPKVFAGLYSDYVATLS